MCDDQKICGTCRHRDYSQVTLGRVKMPWGEVQTVELAPCKLQAVEADAGICVPYMAHCGHCLNHMDAWEPDDSYEDIDEYAIPCPEVPFMDAAYAR